MGRMTSALPEALQSLPEPSLAWDDGTAPPGEGGLEALEAALGHRFARPALLRVALTLASWTNEHDGSGWPSNACLEFFGDAVLDLVAADTLWRRFPTLAEGELTRLRAAVVDEPSLARAAAAIRLGDHLWLGRGDVKRGARTHAGTLADAVEAVLGAVFLDAREAGADPVAAAAAVFERLLGPSLDALRPGDELDPKTRLQHWAQGRHHVTPTYVRIGAPPEPAAPTWRVRVELRFVDGHTEALAYGEGRSLKRAEREAATRALEHIAAAKPEA